MRTATISIATLSAALAVSACSSSDATLTGATGASGTTGTGAVGTGGTANTGGTSSTTGGKGGAEATGGSVGTGGTGAAGSGIGGASGKGGSSSGGGFDCAKLCAKINAAACSGDKPADCMNSCAVTQNAATSKGCSVQLDAYGTCYEGLTVTCDPATMKASVPAGSCMGEQTALATCLSAAGMGGAGGSGNPMGTTIVDAFSADAPQAKSCHDCLATKLTGILMLMMGSVDCGMVSANCGPKDEACGPTVDCITSYHASHPTAKLDCAVDKCLPPTVPEPNDFFNCAADRCGAECDLTVGFLTLGCPLVPVWTS